jgi:DNA-directed RNA polymerase I, II, and III subunit RPABC2
MNIMVSKTKNVDPKKNIIGPPKLTRFERARIVGARTLQISMGAPLLIEVPEGLTTSVDLAMKELEAGVLPITIRRRLPDGTHQDIPVQWLK